MDFRIKDNPTNACRASSIDRSEEDSRVGRAPQQEEIGGEGDWFYKIQERTGDCHTASFPLPGEQERKLGRDTKPTKRVGLICKRGFGNESLLRPGKKNVLPIVDQERSVFGYPCPDDNSPSNGQEGHGPIQNLDNPKNICFLGSLESLKTRTSFDEDGTSEKCRTISAIVESPFTGDGQVNPGGGKAQSWRSKGRRVAFVTCNAARERTRSEK